MDANENKQGTLNVARDVRASAFGRNLRIVMDERSLSLKAVAEICAVNSSVVSGWLSGKSPNNLLAVQRLSKALGLSFEWLLTESDNHPGARNLSLQDLFEEHDVGMSGIFKIEAKKLTRRD